MGKVCKLFIYAVGLIAITFDEVTKAINEASAYLEKEKPPLLNQFTNYNHKL